jgi:hypothetical protein
MNTDLEHFNALIPDREKVAKEGRILPKMDPDYKQALKKVAEGEKELEQYLLDQQQKILKCSVCFELKLCKRLSVLEDHLHRNWKEPLSVGNSRRPNQKTR